MVEKKVLPVIVIHTMMILNRSPTPELIIRSD